MTKLVFTAYSSADFKETVCTKIFGKIIPKYFLFRSKTNVHFLVFQLILADTLVSCITMPMEAIWRLTIQWYADNLTCKVRTHRTADQ
jgi:hypothetical protein